MRFLLRLACLCWFASAVLLPTTLDAQAAPAAAAPGIPKTDQQKSGEAIFQLNCTLCHVYSGDKKRFAVQASTELIGLFKKPGLTDDGVRQFIVTGLPGRMPSFRYTLAAWELDDLVAYLRIR
jgi:mono/diheme cytochrome c family protein